MVVAAIRIGSRALKNGVLWGIAAAAFIALFALDLPFPLIVIGAGVTGWIGGRVAPKLFATGGGHGAGGKSYGPAVIDDETPTPEHARFNWPHFFKVLAAALLLWGSGMAVIIAVFGWGSTLAQMGWFFTKAALLTFGGAYAVLPYVYQAAVEHYQWVTPLQMIDGLRARRDHAGSADHGGGLRRLCRRLDARSSSAPTHVSAAAALAAVVVTYFTFLPSFIFILLGGPLVETTHGELRFTAPLTGDHRRCGRRDPQSGGVFCVPRAVAGRPRRPL